MSITFGSVGDIIAIGQIAWSLAQALTDSKGSAKEYQGLIKELRAFERAVLQIVALWQNYDSPDVVTTDIAKDWLDTLRAFQEKVDKKYGRSLAASGSGNRVKDASKKVLWLKEKEDILDLRRKLSSASDTITMLTLAAMGKSNKLAEGEIKFRVGVVHRMLEDAKKRAEEQAAQLKAIDEKIEMQSKISDLILSNVKSGIVSLTQVHSMTIDIKNLLRLFQSHIKLQQSTPRGIGTGWQSEPMTLEDALGFRYPLPLEIVTSWKILDLILLEQFEKRPGRQKVLKGEFAIEEGITGQDISRENEFSMCFRPGQKIDMSMVFSDLDASSNHCPRCGAKSEASAEARTQCTSCQMWFQRLVEIDNESDPEPIPERAKRQVAVRNSVRTKKTQVIVSTPADFQRVRLMSILRLKEQKAKEGPQQQTSPYATDDGAEFLEREFKKNPKPTTQDLRQFAEDMGVELARINNWFQNRRLNEKQEKKQEAELRNRRGSTEGEKKLENVETAYWQSSLGLGDLQDIPQSRRHSFETGSSLRRPSSSIRSPDIASRKLEDEILRQIRTEGLLDEIDLDNIDANQEDQISERIAEAFKKRQIERTAGITEQEQLQYEYGGPLTPSPADSPMTRSYQHTPSSLRVESLAVRGSEALNSSMKEFEESMRNIPMLDSLAPTPQVVSSGFTPVKDDSENSGSSDADRESDIPDQLSDTPDNQNLSPTHRGLSMTTATSFDLDSPWILPPPPPPPPLNIPPSRARRQFAAHLAEAKQNAELILGNAEAEKTELRKILNPFATDEDDDLDEEVKDFTIGDLEPRQAYGTKETLAKTPGATIHTKFTPEEWAETFKALTFMPPGVDSQHSNDGGVDEKSS